MSSSRASSVFSVLKADGLMPMPENSLCSLATLESHGPSSSTAGWSLDLQRRQERAPDGCSRSTPLAGPERPECSNSPLLVGSAERTSGHWRATAG